MSCSWFNRRGRPVSWSRTEHTTEHKCAQVMALHTTELALHTTGHICFDSLACLQIAFLTFEYSLQLLVLPDVCLTITENNALTTIVPVTHLNARTPLQCFGAESTRSRTAILSATWPVVCCAMLGCVQFGSVVWRVTRAIINIRTSMDRKQNSEFI